MTMKNDLVTEIVEAINSGRVEKGVVLRALEKSGKKNAKAKAKANQTDPRTKGYSDENVRKMVSLIKEGHTSHEIIKKLFPTIESRQTLRRYLDRHYTFKGYAKKYWKMLLANDLTDEDEPVEKTEEVTVEVRLTEKEAVETEEVKPTNATEQTYMLDPYLIINREERELFPAVIKKLEKEGVRYFIYGKNLIQIVAKTYRRYAAEFAKNVLLTQREHFVDSSLNLQLAAATGGHTVIVAHKRTAEECRCYGVKAMTAQEYVAK